MPKYIVQGYVRNGAYRRVGLAIEKGSIEEVKAALAEVDDSTGAYGKANLNHIEINQDGQERSINQVAVEAFSELELKDKKRKDFISILEELIASDKIDKGHPSIITALNKALLSTRENSTFNQSIKAIINKLKETNTEFQYNLYKSEHFLDTLKEIKHKIDGKKFKEIVQINALGALDNEHSIAFLLLVKNGILTKSLVSDALANKILDSYKARDLLLSLEELRSLVGDKLTPDYIRERLSEAIKTSSEEKIKNLLRYCNDHKEEFSNQPLVSDKDLELPFKENEEIFILLLNTENSISADALKNFLSQSIRNNNPKIAMLLVAYYLRNEASLKSEIGVNLLSKDDLYKVFEKRNEQNWKELGAIIQSSGAIEIDKQYLEDAGWGGGARKIGSAPFIMTLTPASLKLAIDHNDLSIANLSAADIDLLTKKIASGTDLDFQQYIEILFSTDPQKYPVLLNKIVEASYSNGFTLEILIDKNLVSSLLPQAALNLYKRGNIKCLEKLADRNLIALTEFDENGNTLLHHALANNHYELAHKIIDSAGNEKIKGRALIQATNKDGFTPLLYLLRQQPYSKSKSLVMGSIMMRNSFEYSREQIGERIDHILLAIPDIETAKDFLLYLEQATKTPEEFNTVAQNIFNKAVLDNNQIMVEAILEQCKGKFNINSLTYFNHNGSERTEAPIFVAYANATATNNYAIVHLLLRNKNLDINKCGGTQDVTILHQAAIDGNHDLVLKILEREPKEKLIPDIAGIQHMLLDAIGAAHSLGTKATLETAELKKLDGLRAVFNSIINDSRVNVNCTDDKGDTPALLIYRNLQATKIKIKQLQELGEQKPKNISSLATDLRDKATKLFVNSTSELKNLQEYEKSLTNQLSSLIHNDKVDVLIENNQKESLASLSITNNDVDTLQLIVTRAIAENNKFELWHTFNQSDKNGNSPLMHAYASGNKEMLELVRIASGSESENPEALYQKQNKDKQNILIAACKGGNKEMVVDAFLHLKNKDLSKGDILGNTPLHHATSKPDILKFLLDQDESKKALNTQNAEGQTLLIKAVLEGNVEAIKLLLAKGVNVNSTDKHGNTPLMYACILDRVDIINELLNRPEVDVRAVSNIGATAYMYAALRSSIDEAQGKGSDQNKDWDGNPEVITALISRGADPLFGTYYQSFQVTLRLSCSGLLS